MRGQSCSPDGAKRHPGTGVPHFAEFILGPAAGRTRGSMRAPALNPPQPQSLCLAPSRWPAGARGVSCASADSAR